MKLKSDLPIKYSINAHRLCESYPDELDILYDVISHVMSGNKRKKTWKTEDFRIRPEELKTIFPDMSDDVFKEKVKTILMALRTNNYISIIDGETPDNRYIGLTDTGLTKLYEI